MADENLLQRLGIQINPISKTKVGEMSNQEVIQEIINNSSRGITRYAVIGLGSILGSEGGADCGAKILEKFFSMATTRDFNLYSVSEMVIGAGMIYFGAKVISRKDAQLKSIATSLNKHYIQD